MPLMDDVVKLKAELALLQSQQSSQQALLDNQLATFSDKLERLSAQIHQQSSALQIAIDDTAHHAIETSTSSDHSVPDAWQHNNTSPIMAPSELSQTSPALNLSTASPHEATNQNETTSPSVNKPLTAQLSTSLEQLGQSFEHLGSALLGPFSGLAEQATRFYQHYHAKGLGPVFLMTVAGIITLTLGFGYLLQYSINHWFSELGKALLGLSVANAIIGGGIFIRQRRAGMEEFGSGIVGLGLILNYLCIYFLGPYFEIIPESVSFILLLINTIVGYSLSFKLATKVVAVVALLGGSLAPLILLDATHAPVLYLPYLLFIGLCSLAQSHKLSWPLLMETTALLHIACVQILGYFLLLPFYELTALSIIALLSIHALFYLYGIGSLWLLIKVSFNARLLVVPIALLSFTLYTVSEYSPWAGELFAMNAVICGLLYLFIKRDKQISALVLVFAGSFAGFAALYLLSPDFLGMVLLLEALLLLWVAQKEDVLAVRIEAYVLLLIGIGSNLISLIDGLTSSYYGQTSWWQYQGFISLSMVMTCVAVYISCRLLKDNQDKLIPIEIKLAQALRELLSFLYASTLLVIAYFISDDYCLNTLPFISLLLLHLSAKHQLRVTEVLAWLWILPLGALILFGMLDANSLSFADQALNAKLARIELFIALLLVYYWYQKHDQGAKLMRFAYYVQLACYLALPLLLLPKILRSYPDYLALYLWCSALISLGLAHFVKHKSLLIETQILSILAITTTASLCLDELWQGLAALGIGALLLGTLTLRYQQLPPHWQALLKLHWHIGPFYFALVCAVIIQTLTGMFTDSWAITALMLAGYFALLLERDNPLGKHFAKALKPAYSLAYGVLFTCAVTPLLIHIETPLSLNLNNVLLDIAEFGILLILGWYFIGKKAAKRLAIRLHQKTLSTQILFWGWHMMLTLSYFLWSYQLSPSLAAPTSAILMVIHGSVLMFISLRPQNTTMVRLAGILFALTCVKVLFFDMASFELVQKVAAFMIIGVILLTVAYFYQKTKNQLEAV